MSKKKEESEFGVGDVVVLASGGPMMTVVAVHDAERVECMWFVEAEPRSGAFVTAALLSGKFPAAGGGSGQGK